VDGVAGGADGALAGVAIVGMRYSTALPQVRQYRMVRWNIMG